MIIPGFLISAVTFPGVVVHELAHVAACKMTGTLVYKTCYFRLGNPAGYVIHGQPGSVWRHIWIGVGPFFFNTLLGFLIGAALWYWGIDIDHAGGASLIPFWLALSIGMHAFPSTGDARGIWRAVWSSGAPMTARLLGTPLVGVIFVGALGSMVWLDAIYGGFVAIVLPKLLFKYIALQVN